MFDLDTAIDQWRKSLQASDALTDDAVMELENHLRETLGKLRGSEITDQESWMIATNRLGQPHHLTMEYEKVNAKAMWQKRLAWMVGGYVCGGLLSQLIGGTGSLIAAVVTLAGYPGSISGIVAVVVMAVCWAGLLGFLIRKERVESELPNPMALTTAIITALVLGVAMNWMGILIQQRTVSVSQMGEFYQWQTYAMIPLNICLLIACTCVVIKYGRSRKAAIA